MLKAQGFSLLETLVAVTILTVGVSGVAQLFVVVTTANQRAAAITTATLLGQDKVEQLRSLAWGFDSLHRRVTDTSSDTTVSPVAPTGGTGLQPSPGGSLDADTSGYCDYFDAGGQLLPASGLAVPEGTVFVRRWAIDPLPSDPDRTIVIQVRVLSRAFGPAAAVVLTSARTRGPA